MHGCTWWVGSTHTACVVAVCSDYGWKSSQYFTLCVCVWLLFVQIVAGSPVSTLHCVYDCCLFRLQPEVWSSLTVLCMWLLFVEIMTGVYWDYDWCLFRLWLVFAQIMTGFFCCCFFFVQIMTGVFLLFLRLWLVFVQIMTGVCSDYDWCLFRLWLVFVQIMTWSWGKYSTLCMWLWLLFVEIMTGVWWDYDRCLLRLWLVFVEIMTGVFSDYDWKSGKYSTLCMWLWLLFVEIMTGVWWDYDRCLLRLWLVFVEIMTGVFSDYDWKSGKYSTWTESRWDLFKVRVFLIPSKRAEVRTHLFCLLHGNSALHCIHSVSFVSHSQCLSLSLSLCPPSLHSLSLSLSLSLSCSISCLSYVDWIHLLFSVYFLCCACLMYSYVWFVCELFWRRQWIFVCF